jgi:hypothetical protein
MRVRHLFGTEDDDRELDLTPSDELEHYAMMQSYNAYALVDNGEVVLIAHDGTLFVPTGRDTSSEDISKQLSEAKQEKTIAEVNRELRAELNNRTNP